ncbi:MAG: thioredoxin TrxC [Acidobacteriota bacterium]
MSESLELVCPHCEAINRVPAARLGDGPVCGKCGHAVLPAQPVTLTGRTMSRFLEKNQLPVLVDFWAPWCGPCKMFAPVFAQMSGQYVSRVRFAKVDTEAEQALGARYAIRSIPTLALFVGGREVDRVSGALPGPQLQAWLARHGL